MLIFIFFVLYFLIALCILLYDIKHFYQIRIICKQVYLIHIWAPRDSSGPWSNDKQEVPNTSNLSFNIRIIQSAGALEYTNCISAEK